MTRKLILVIDDEPDIVEFLTALFEDQGYETIKAHNGETGMEMARRYKPDLITLDITMPGKSGLAVFRELRSDPEFYSVPIFIITGVQEFRQLIYTRSLAPPEGYMEKPIDPDTLLECVREIIGPG